MNKGKIVRVAGPLVVAEGLKDVKMYEVVRVGNPQLIGEVIEIKGDRASIQVYEETEGVGPDEPVVNLGEALCVELGPGLVGSIYDGIQRPLDVIREKSGDLIGRGISIPGLDRQKKWLFNPQVKKGENVSAGDVLGWVQETPLVKHKIMVPLGVEGEVEEIKAGEFTIEEAVTRVRNLKTGQTEAVKMLQRWPVRILRPYKEKLSPDEPLITGQRVIDTFFPVTKGGTACIPGPFGSGKTVVQHQLAKWSDAEIIIFIGCGERGNEMADVLLEFPELKDPASGEPLIKRTVLIANTSNMPVAAREASVYTGITIAEYFRDMGYRVALMADSTSRWAEALREISGRMEEMPGEEGYPAYLATRIASFYERAGKVISLGKEGRIGTLSVIGAVSPPGGDLADPVVQSTLRVVKVFWSLEDQLAFRRHFPAISWLRSYSLYEGNIESYLKKNISEEFPVLRKEALAILQEEASLEEIVRLVGLESLSAKERLVLETAKSIREDFLAQFAFDPEDTYTSLKKQHWMLKQIVLLHRLSQDVLEKGVEFDELEKLKIKAKIARMKFIPEKDFSQFTVIEREMQDEIREVMKKNV